MSFIKRFSGTDVVICVWFPVSLVVLFISLLFVHGANPGFEANLIAFIWVLVLIVTPIFVVLHIILNRNRTAESWLWTESVLAGIWLATGSGMLLDYWAHGLPSSLLAIVIGVAVGLTPLITRAVRPSR
jgi:hypothetical protein